MEVSARLKGVLLVLVGVVLSAGALTACGGEDKQEYAQQVEEVLGPLSAELQSVGMNLEGAGSAEELAAAFEEVQARIEQSISELEAIDPPSDVEEIQADLIATIESFSSSLDPVREAAEKGNLQQLEREAQILPEAAATLQGELVEITRRAADAGVPVGAGGSPGS